MRLACRLLTLIALASPSTALAYTVDGPFRATLPGTFSLSGYTFVDQSASTGGTQADVVIDQSLSFSSLGRIGFLTNDAVVTSTGKSAGYVNIGYTTSFSDYGIALYGEHICDRVLALGLDISLNVVLWTPRFNSGSTKSLDKYRAYSDSDGDGLDNYVELLDGSRCTDPDVADTDGDGLDDGDEVDVYETDPLDTNTDGDDMDDGDEVAAGRDPLTYDEPVSDIDGDAIPDEDDNCPLEANVNQNDTDGDLIGNACDACKDDADNDADGDGVCGDEDNCPAEANPHQADNDADGTGNDCDACKNDADDDADGDGACGDEDNCAVEANADQADLDGDGQGDACDVCAADAADDADGDGLCGDIDNCAGLSNAEQADLDGDGQGDACDTDDDGDGSADDEDGCPREAAYAAVPAWHIDTDGDGFGGAATLSSCTRPTGYVADDTDCDDTDAGTSPGAAEVCDGVDNNCDGSADEGQPLYYYYPDADGDGYGAERGEPVKSCRAVEGYTRTTRDCDDADPLVNFAATEICDLRDNDCDGDVDEGFTERTYYPDHDGDGYGNDYYSTERACMLPPGYSSNRDDCADGAADVYPGAPEFCDFRDNDCDDETDEGLPLSTYYADSDRDGYGDPDQVYMLCQQTYSDLSDNSDDCDDDDSEVSPDAQEVCEDGLDNDCDAATLDECSVVVEHCGAITADETWAGDEIHLVTCDIYVAGGAVLTIEDGAIVEFEAGTGLTIGEGSAGALDVLGDEEGVLFTSAADEPASGDWDGLLFSGSDQSSILRGATVEYGGGNGYGGVFTRHSGLVGGILTLEDCTIINNSGSGVAAYIADVEVSGSLIASNADYGVYIGYESSLAGSFVDNVVTGNALNPAYVAATDLALLDASSSFTGNGEDTILVWHGELTLGGTWQALDVPYHFGVMANFHGAATSTLTIDPGAELRFASGAGLVIHSGALYAVGTPEAPILFTSAQDTPAAGDWWGLELQFFSAQSTIAYADISYGGAGYGAVYFRGGSPDSSISHSAVRYSATYGITLSLAAPIISDMTYEGNVLGNLSP